MGGGFVIPEVVTSHFLLRSGDLVADFGAGSGAFMAPLAKAVGNTGRVYACEIQKVLVESLGEKARVQRLTNIQTLWCDLEEPNGINIPNGELDAAILVNTLFQIEDKLVSIKEMHRTLRVGGKFFVIDWTESFAGMGPTAGHVVTGVMATNLLESNGFVLEREFPAGEHHYGLAFRKIWNCDHSNLA